MCINTITIVVTDKETKRARHETVPCGKCNFCKQARQQDWSFRLMYESRDAPSAHFIGFTYRETKTAPGQSTVPMTDRGVRTLEPKHIYQWVKSVKQLQSRFLRKQNGPHTARLVKTWKIRYYGSMEYGSQTERPHYHIIIFGIHPGIVREAAKLWHHGISHWGTVSGKSINYTTKYLIDNDESEVERVKPKNFMSRNPGIGHQYVKEKQAWHVPIMAGEKDYESLRFYYQDGKFKKRLPRYWQRVFTPFEKKIGSMNAKIMAEKRKYEEMITLVEMYQGDKVRALEQYNAVRREKHDKIKSKSKALSKII